MDLRSGEAQPPEPAVPRGRYEHFKGGFYDVLHLARDSETEAWWVVYRPVDPGAGIWLRSLENFTEFVTRDQLTRPRFRYVGPTPS